MKAATEVSTPEALEQFRHSVYELKSFFRTIHRLSQTDNPTFNSQCDEDIEYMANRGEYLAGELAEKMDEFELAQRERGAQ